jgi:hypothetical protein
LLDPGGPTLAMSMVVHGSLLRALNAAKAADLPVREDRCLEYPKGDGPTSVDLVLAVHEPFPYYSAAVWSSGLRQLATSLPKAVTRMHVERVCVVITGAPGDEGGPPRRRFVIDEANRWDDLVDALEAIPGLVDAYHVGVFRWDHRTRAWTGVGESGEGGAGVREPRRSSSPEIGDGAEVVPPADSLGEPIVSSGQRGESDQVTLALPAFVLAFSAGEQAR